MAKMLLKSINLTIDKENYNPIICKQGDTGRYLLFKILNNGVPFSLAGKTVRVYGVKKDGSKIYNNLTIIDGANGTCELKLTSQILFYPGCLKLDLTIYDETDTISLIPFTLDIIASIRDDAAIESTNEFSALSISLNKVATWNKEFEDKSDKLEELYTPRLNGLSEQLADIVQHTIGYCNLREYSNLVINNNWDDAIKKAFVDYNVVEIPSGTFEFTKLVIPNGKTLRGNGASSVIKTKSNSGEFVIMTEDGVNSNKILIEKLRIYNDDLLIKRGGIKINGSLRGITIKNLWFENICYGIRTEGTIWGKVSINDISMLYLNTATTDDSYGISIENSTTFLRDIEIIGSYNIGFEHRGGRTGLLSGFNIAGSNGYQMTTGLKLSGTSSFSIESGWIEQINGEQGKQKTIDIFNSNITLKDVNCSLGSIYVDNSLISIDSIYLGNATSSVLGTGGSNITLSNINHITLKNGFCDYQKSDADYFYSNFKTDGYSSEKIIPTLTSTNGTLAVISDETVDKLNTITKKVVSSNNQGVKFVMTGLNVNTNYTFSVWVKCLDNVNYCGTTLSVGNSNGDGMLRKRTYIKDKWIKIFAYGATSLDGSLTINLTTSSLETSTKNTILISDFSCRLGFNPTI